jgi:hypothetical protein
MRLITKIRGVRRRVVYVNENYEVVKMEFSSFLSEKPTKFEIIQFINSKKKVLTDNELTKLLNDSQRHLMY